MKIIVGSTALKYFGLNRCEPKDVDTWLDSFEDIPTGEDSHVIPKSIMQELHKYSVDNYATPDAVYTIKISHFVYDVKWDKTKLDVLWLKSNGCKVVEPLYTLLCEYWKSVHGNKYFLSLNMGKEEFFTDNVNYLFDHDYLHQLVAYPNAPIYTHCLKDGQEVLIDKGKFDKMSFNQQVRMFREEITVIACERWLIDPKYSGKISWYRAYMFSLRKTVTTLTKGWASRFLVENIEHLVKPHFSYFKYIKTTLNI